MLRRLSVRNLAIVDDLELEFGPGLTVITGETGPANRFSWTP